MPNNYISSLVKKGKGTEKELEQKWDNAVKQAKKQNKDDNYAYITSIFNKMIHEVLLSDLEKAKKEIPQPEVQEIGNTNKAKDDFEKWEDDNFNELPIGQYQFKNDDCNGKWKQGDTIDITKPLKPIKKIMDIPTYEVIVNNIIVYISKDFLDTIGLPDITSPESISEECDKEKDLSEDDGGVGDVGSMDMGVSNMGTSTSDIAGYSNPFTTKSKKRKKPNLFWDNEELLDELATDFSWTWNKIKDKSKNDEIPPVTDEIKKYLKIHSPDLKEK